MTADDLPSDLRAYFDARPLPAYPNSRINPLSLDESLATFASVSEYDPVVEELGFLPLDDADDSNPYGYLVKTPMAGAIFHYCHDGDRTVKFASLDDWVASMKEAGETGRDISTAQYQSQIPAQDIGALEQYIISDFDERSGLFSESTIYLVANLGAGSLGAVNTLLKGRDFFIREALAEFVSSTPHPDFLAVAEALAADSHPQVARPGTAALNAVRREIANG